MFKLFQLTNYDYILMTCICVCLQLVKQVFGVFGALSVHALEDDDNTGTSGAWMLLVQLLSSLQLFANALPAALKPRARELVQPAQLVAVIQARALGRTYSLQQQCEIGPVAATAAGGDSAEQRRCIALVAQLGPFADDAVTAELHNALRKRRDCNGDPASEIEIEPGHGDVESSESKKRKFAVPTSAASAAPGVGEQSVSHDAACPATVLTADYLDSLVTRRAADGLLQSVPVLQLRSDDVVAGAQVVLLVLSDSFMQNIVNDDYQGSVAVSHSGGGLVVSKTVGAVLREDHTSPAADSMVYVRTPSGDGREGDEHDGFSYTANSGDAAIPVPRYELHFMSASSDSETQSDAI